MSARRKYEDNIPLAVSTQGGLLAALLTLLIGTINGSRAWVVLIRAAMAFILVSGILKLITAGVMQAVRWKATEDGSDREVQQTAQVIRSHAGSPETTEKESS